MSVTSVVPKPNSIVPGGWWWRRRWWWWWWCGSGCCCCGGGRGGGGSSGGGGGGGVGCCGHERFFAVALAAATDAFLAVRSRHLAVVVADVKLGIQLEEIQAPVKRVRVEFMPPHGPAPPVETDVP